MRDKARMHNHGRRLVAFAASLLLLTGAAGLYLHHAPAPPPPEHGAGCECVLFGDAELVAIGFGGGQWAVMDARPPNPCYPVKKAATHEGITS